MTNWSAKLPKICPKCSRELFYGQCSPRSGGCGFGLASEPIQHADWMKNMPTAEDFNKHLKKREE